MRRLARWAAYLLGAAGLLALVAWAAIRLLSDRELGRRYEVQALNLIALTDSTSLTEGERLARIRGCPGCHGARLQGTVPFDLPRVARLVAPALPRLARENPAVAFDRAVRRGVGRSGRGLVAMPSEMFQHLTDRDVELIFSWVRSLEAGPDTLPGHEIRILGRLGLVLGEFKTAPRLMAEETERVPAPVPGDILSLGRYLAKTSCTECHGLNLQGSGVATPGLAIVAGYSAEEFRHLMRTGLAKGGRELRLMTEMGRGRFTHLTDPEVAALYAFLRRIPAGSPGSQP
jgi:mono/diheme cytochrome c family protein